MLFNNLYILLAPTFVRAKLTEQFCSTNDELMHEWDVWMKVYKVIRIKYNSHSIHKYNICLCWAYSWTKQIKNSATQKGLATFRTLTFRFRICIMYIFASFGFNHSSCVLDKTPYRKQTTKRQKLDSKWIHFWAQQ